jgi:prepilin-type N-terminal cleavage/methylation domain-containing protein
MDMGILTSIGKTHQRPQTDRLAGFSLIEVLVALVILALIATGVMSALDFGIMLNGSSRDYTTVSNLAKSRLEQLVALPFDATQLASGTTHTEVTDDGLFDLNYVVRDFAISSSDVDPTTVFAGAPVAAGGFVNVKIITVTVAAHGSAPGIRSVTVESVKHIR